MVTELREDITSVPKKNHFRASPDILLIQNFLNEDFTSIDTESMKRSDWLRVLKKAARNKVLFAFAKSIPPHLKQSNPWLDQSSGEIISQGDLHQKRLSKTLTFLEEKLGGKGIDYLVVKTNKFLPYVTYDVDVLVKPNDFQTAQKTLAEYGISKKHPRTQAHKQSNIFIENNVLIDLHKGFSWEGGRYLEDELPWDGPIFQDIAGISCPTPRNEVEVALTLSHILFERRYLTLLDLLFLRQCSYPDLEWRVILDQARRFCWYESLLRVCSICEAVNHILNPIGNPLFRFIKGGSSNSDLYLRNYVDMPYIIPIRHVLKIYLEKSLNYGLPMRDMIYYLFFSFRFMITNGYYLPYHIDWYPFSRLKS